jgi:hypothetical protein
VLEIVMKKNFLSGPHREISEPWDSSEPAPGDWQETQPGASQSEGGS